MGKTCERFCVYLSFGFLFDLWKKVHESFEMLNFKRHSMAEGVCVFL